MPVCANLPWIIGMAAEPLSALAGVLQAVMLSVIVVIAGWRGHPAGRTPTLMIYTAVFFVLLFPASTQAHVAGDQMCLRGGTAVLLLGGLLALCLVAVLVGLVLLVERAGGSMVVIEIMGWAATVGAVLSVAMFTIIGIGFVPVLAQVAGPGFAVATVVALATYAMALLTLVLVVRALPGSRRRDRLVSWSGGLLVVGGCATAGIWLTSKLVPPSVWGPVRPVCGAAGASFSGDANLAQSFSEYMGVLAGIMLVVVAYQLGRREGGGGRRSVVMFFLAGFFSCVMSSRMFDVVAGDQVCVRTQVLGTMALLLSVNAIVPVILAMTALFELLDQPPQLVALARLFSYLLLPLGGTGVVVFVHELMRDLHAAGWQGFEFPLWFLVVYLNVALAVLVLVLRGRPHTAEHRVMALRTGVYVMLGGTGLLSAFCLVSLALHEWLWEPVPSGWVIYPAIVVSMLGPIANMLACARALPRARPVRDRVAAPR